MSVEVEASVLERLLVLQSIDPFFIEAFTPTRLSISLGIAMHSTSVTSVMQRIDEGPPSSSLLQMDPSRACMKVYRPGPEVLDYENRGTPSRLVWMVSRMKPSGCAICTWRPSLRSLAESCPEAKSASRSRRSWGRGMMVANTSMVIGRPDDPFCTHLTWQYGKVYLIEDSISREQKFSEDGTNS